MHREAFIIPFAESVVFWVIIVIVKAIMLPLVLYEVENWSLILRKQHKLRVITYSLLSPSVMQHLTISNTSSHLIQLLKF
jgi:hypothetical protein